MREYSNSTVPVETIPPQRQADPISPVSHRQTYEQKEHPPGFASFIADIEILLLTHGTHIDPIALPVRIAITQDQLFLAARTRDQPFVLRWTRLAFSKAVAAMKENLHVCRLSH